MIEQAVQARHADVEHALDVAAHQLRRDGGFLGHGQVGGAAAEDGDAGLFRLITPVDGDAARGLVVDRVLDLGRDGLVRQPVRARDEHAVGAFDEAAGDLGGLRGLLSLRQDDLRERVAQRAVVVDLGETDVLVREQAQVIDGRLNARRAGGDAFEQLAQLLLVDRRTSGADSEAV
jgi:hypothetical protein